MIAIARDKGVIKIENCQSHCFAELVSSNYEDSGHITMAQEKIADVSVITQGLLSLWAALSNAKSC